MTVVSRDDRAAGVLLDAAMGDALDGGARQSAGRDGG
jgi:hypothetical protein